jgi:condensin complex subunit 3
VRLSLYFPFPALFRFACAHAHAYAHPPSDVRRAILANIRIDPASLPLIIQRARDVEPPTRRLVYTAVLLPNIWLTDPTAAGLTAAKPTPASAPTHTMGPTHPRALSIAQREAIVRAGLGDREDAVRAACGVLLAAWVRALGTGAERGSALPKVEEEEGALGGEDDARNRAPNGKPNGRGGASNANAGARTSKADTLALEDTLALLGSFDLVSGENADVARDALVSVWATEPALFAALAFPGAWARRRSVPGRAC